MEAFQRGMCSFQGRMFIKARESVGTGPPWPLWFSAQPGETPPAHILGKAFTAKGFRSTEGTWLLSPHSCGTSRFRVFFRCT